MKKTEFETAFRKGCETNAKPGLPGMTWVESRRHWRKRGTYKGFGYDLTSGDPDTLAEKIQEFKGLVDSGAFSDAGKDETELTFWGFVQRWFPIRVEDLRPRSRECIENVVNRHILPHFGNVPIGSIKPMDVESLFIKLKGRSASLRGKILSTLRNIFDCAVDNNEIIKSPVPKRKRAGGAKTRKKVPLTNDQIKELVGAVRGSRAELFVLLCLCAGLRREEALGLLWSNVHLDAPTPYLEVCNTVTLESNNKSTFSSELKSEAAHRKIPLPALLAEALARHRHDYDSVFVVPAMGTGAEMTLSAFDRLWALVVGYTRCDVVKRDENGKAVKDGNGESVKEKKRYPGLVGFHVTPHLLRHTYITLLCASGLDIKKIQYLAGHANVQLTLDVYTEVRNNSPGEVAPFTDAAFAFIGAGAQVDAILDVLAGGS